MKQHVQQCIAIAASAYMLGSTAFAQQQKASEPPPPSEVTGISFGIFGQGNYNMHTANFLQLPYTKIENSENIKNYMFRDGTGIGVSGGILIEAPLASWLNIGLRGGYIGQNATLLSAPTNISVGRSDGSIDPSGLFQRTFNAKLSTVGVELLFGLKPFGGLTVYLGGRVDWAILKRYEQYEEILQPSDGVFENGDRRRNVQTGGLPDVRNFDVANMNSALMAGIGYEIPISSSRAWTLAPEAFYSRGMQSVIRSTSLQPGEYWKTNNVRAGLTLRYYPARDANFDAQDYKMKQLLVLEQTIAKERTKIQEQLRELKQSGVSVKLTNIVGVTENGKEVENPTVRVEQFQATNTVQLLNYVFFNDGSSVFPARYRRIGMADREGFRMQSLAQLKPIDVYYNVLNILGRRMQDNPQTKITLIGCNSNTGAEKGNRKLSRQRAEAVGDYLQDIWKIAATRIAIKDRDLPELPSTTDTPAGQAENRRVEIIPDSPVLLQPMTFETTFRTVTPPALKMDVDISAGAGLKQWSLEFSQFEGRESKSLKSTEGGSDYPKQFVWNIDEDQARIPNASGTVDIKLDITDINNRNSDAPLVAIPIQVITLDDKARKKLADKRLDIYTFGVFNSETNKTTSDLTTTALLQTIKSTMKPSSVVKIEGYVDGENQDGNLDTFLSEQRAQFIAKALGVPTASISTVKQSKGTTMQKVLTNDATLPEGRFYNRALRVEVQTPVG